jgi:hypothetical protein
MTEYKIVAQKVLFDATVLATLISGRKCYVINKNGDCSKECKMLILVFRNKVRYQCRYRVSMEFTVKGLGYGLEDRAIRFRFLAGAEIYILSTENRQALGPN